jgi:hypothetical protein
MMGKSMSPRAARLVLISQMTPIQAVSHLDPSNQPVHPSSGTDQRIVLRQRVLQRQNDGPILALLLRFGYSLRGRSPLLDIGWDYPHGITESAFVYSPPVVGELGT